MARSSRALPLLLLALLPACARRPEAAIPSPPTPIPRIPRSFRLERGLKLTLLPNLPGVSLDDVPETTRRDVEVLAFSGRELWVRWTGTVRVEKPESAKRREDWVRARANAPSKATPVPLMPPDYEDREVSGTLGFPDFSTATELLLPGLWPEGNATLKGTAAVWLSKQAFRELRSSGRARVPFHVSSKLLKDPASSLLSRASRIAGGGDSWNVVPSTHTYVLQMDGQEAALPTVVARNWFGTYEVLADEENPMVLSALPEPPSSRLLDLFAPANVLRTLLGYRVAEVETRREAKR